MARILLVEDNEMSVRLVTEILGHYQHQVVPAHNASECRASLQEHEFDLVLMDVRLPGESGDVLVGEIRRDPRLARLPVLAVTAEAMAGDKDRLLKAGFDDYISKPIDVRHFAKQVAAFLARNKPA